MVEKEAFRPFRIRKEHCKMSATGYWRKSSKRSRYDSLQDFYGKLGILISVVWAN